jgi:hypothetical protein
MPVVSQVVKEERVRRGPGLGEPSAAGVEIIDELG